MADLAFLPVAIAFIHEAALSAELPSFVWGQLDLIFEEAFVNIALYAYPKGAAGQLEILTSTPAPGKLQIELADSGTPYNPLHAKQPNLSDKLEERTSGGLGVFLLKELSDSVSYRYDQGFNRLTFTVSAAAAQAQS